MLPESASLLETVWTGLALVGAACATALLLHVWTSYQSVVAWIEKGRLVWWGPRHRFALGFLVGSGCLLAVWVGFILLGGNALLNPPPVGAERAAASERAGWLLVGLETALLVCQAILMWAWLSVQESALSPETLRPGLTQLVLRAIDLGREMGHAVANDAQLPVGVLDAVMADPTTDPERRRDAAEAIATIKRMMGHVTALHAAIKHLEDAL